MLFRSRYASTSALRSCSVMHRRVWRRDTAIVRCCKKYGIVKEWRWWRRSLCLCQSVVQRLLRQRGVGPGINLAWIIEKDVFRYSVTHYNDSFFGCRDTLNFVSSLRSSISSVIPFTCRPLYTCGATSKPRDWRCNN